MTLKDNDSGGLKFWRFIFDKRENAKMNASLNLEIAVPIFSRAQKILITETAERLGFSHKTLMPQYFTRELNTASNFSLGKALILKH